MNFNWVVFLTLWTLLIGPTDLRKADRRAASPNKSRHGEGKESPKPSPHPLLNESPFIQERLNQIDFASFRAGHQVIPQHRTPLAACSSAPVPRLLSPSGVAGAFSRDSDSTRTCWPRPRQSVGISIVRRRRSRPSDQLHVGGRHCRIASLRRRAALTMQNPTWPAAFRSILSKGHAAPALCSAGRAGY